MYTIQGALSDERISATDKLVAIALLVYGQHEMRLTNKEIAGMISSVETVVSRSLKSLVEFEYITTSLENNSKRVIRTLDKNANPLNNKSTPLSKNAMVSGENPSEPLTKTQTPLTINQPPLAKTQGYLQIPLDKKLNPLIKLLTPLSKNASTLSKNARGFKPVMFENQDFINCCPYEFEKSAKKSAPIYIYYINYLIELKSKVILEIKGCGEKQKPYELTFKDGIATCEVLRASCKKFHEEHPDLYPLPMYTQFIRYWSAPDKKNVPKWYKEQTAKRGTWHLPDRLVTWHENDLKFNSKTYNGKSTQRGTSTLRPTSIAEPSKRTGAGNVAHVEF